MSASISLIHVHVHPTYASLVEAIHLFVWLFAIWRELHLGIFGLQPRWILEMAWNRTCSYEREATVGHEADGRRMARHDMEGPGRPRRIFFGLVTHETGADTTDVDPS